jgi:hypothetical protein
MEIVDEITKKMWSLEKSVLERIAWLYAEIASRKSEPVSRIIFFVAHSFFRTAPNKSLVNCFFPLTHIALNDGGISAKSLLASFIPGYSGATRHSCSPFASTNKLEAVIKKVQEDLEFYQWKIPVLGHLRIHEDRVIVPMIPVLMDGQRLEKVENLKAMFNKLIFDPFQGQLEFWKSVKNVEVSAVAIVKEPPDVSSLYVLEQVRRPEAKRISRFEGLLLKDEELNELEARCMT